MLTYLVAFLLALGLSTALVPVVKSLARRLRLFDRNQSSRKIHSAAIPRLGGVAIVAAFYAPLAGLLWHANDVSSRFYADPGKALALFGGGLTIFALGLYDDLRGAGAKLKFAVQLGVALGLYHYGFRIEQIALPFAGHLSLGALALPFTAFWIVGVINAFNLIDGLDGLAGGIAFFSVATTFVLAFSRGDVLMSLYMASLGGAVLGFLIFNFNPASIFMGDSGSMFLGFVLAATSMQTSQKSSTTVAMLVPVVALGLPIMDTLLAMIRRFLRGRSMFSADREHIHHRLLALGYTHRRAVLTLYGLCVFLCSVALAMTYANSLQSTLLLLVVAIVVGVLIRKLGYLTPVAGAPALLDLRQRNLDLRAAVRETGERLREVESREQAWQCIEPVAELLGAHEMRLELRTSARPGGRETAVFTWQVDADQRSAPTEAHLPIGSGDAGSLRVTWRDGRAQVDRDQEIALEVLTDHMAGTVERLERRAAADPQIVRPLKRG
ncbi:MAG: glycosyltransferase family 4 protein [Myxococcales bacterium]